MAGRGECSQGPAQGTARQAQACGESEAESRGTLDASLGVRVNPLVIEDQGPGWAPTRREIGQEERRQSQDGRWLGMEASLESSGPMVSSMAGVMGHMLVSSPRAPPPAHQIHMLKPKCDGIWRWGLPETNRVR